MKHQLLVPLALFSFVFVSIQPALAQNQVYADGWLGGTSHRQKATNTVGSASASDNGPTGAYSSSASFGSVSVHVNSFYPGYPLTSGYASASGSWSDTVTIQPDNPALMGTPGTAVFTYYLSGSASSTDYQLCQFNVSTECQCGGPSTFGGTPVSSSFTITRPFTFGTPLSIYMGLGALAQGSSGEQKMNVSLTAGGITVLDNGANEVSYTSGSSTGTARSKVLANGEAYTSFSLTNSVGHQTTLALLAGTANANTNITAAFTSARGTNGFVSDAVDFSGTGTNLFALQISYDPAAAIAQFGDEAKTLLMWFNPLTQIWTNAVSGNSDGGLASHFFAGAFDPNTQFQLGNFGVDVVKHVVWAVLDHNSQFAAGAVVAPPALRCLGVVVLTNGVQVSLQGPPPGPFFVQSLPDLGGNNWTELGRALPNADGVANFFDSTLSATNSQRFYRAHE